MLTPKQIQDLADPIEKIYMRMVDELLVNIGKHITSPTWTHTASWEIQKLAELGQLTQENAAIINAWIKYIPEETRATMEATRAAALDRLEKQLEQAAQAGYVQRPVTDTTVQVLRDALQQAEDRFNLVNTTMLQSSVDQYVRGVQLTEEEVSRLEAQKQASNAILNEAALNIAQGVETRRTAVNRAIKRISDEGLTGFIDRAGRNWTPEAYVNMVTRTTVHNVAIESTRARMQDYNTQVFQVSSHAGARPLCYPYQGKFYSWDNSAGEIPLGNGTTVRYEPLNSTSYGQAAGLFGINCGHFPIPIIPGVTIPHGADNIQPKAENDKAYAESQEQRALERQIREAKRVVEMAGDTATKADKAKVRELQAKMREFTARAGLARRYDREQIVKSGENTGLSEGQKRARINNEVTREAKSMRIKANPPAKLASPLTTAEIISKVSGGDTTDGSCASCVLAYTGNRAGFDVRDFRGGASCELFSYDDTTEALTKLRGVKAWGYYRINEITQAHDLLKHVEPGKEYGLYVGQHAAVVRKVGSDYEYLELQHPIANRNGFHPLDNWALKNRFSCVAKVSASDKSYGALIDLQTLASSPDFEPILAYLNTQTAKQQKGATGSVK